MSWERALGVELEWNPFSVASRAARAERAGRIGEALRLYVQAGQHDRVRLCLAANLPDGVLRQTLIEAANEWLELSKGVAAAQAQGLPEGWTEWFSDTAVAPGEVLWRTADLVAAASRHNVETPRIRQALQRENQKLRQLVGALRAARGGLVELALSEGGQPLDFQKSQERLRQLERAVKDLDAEVGSLA